MNNDELKKKIVDIIQMKLQECPFQPIGITYGEAAEYVADALIAAGIGDVKTVQHISASATALAVLDAAKAEHRAEVAERALDLCETAYILALNHRATEGISGQAIASDLGVHKFFMEQAEKELAEERKDE